VKVDRSNKQQGGIQAKVQANGPRISDTLVPLTSVTLGSAPFVRCRKHLKLSSGGGEFGSKNTNNTMGGLAESLFAMGMESDGRVCGGAFGRNLASVVVKMFSHLIYFLKKFYNLAFSIRLQS
jgi:hypothetical protein